MRSSWMFLPLACRFTLPGEGDSATSTRVVRAWKMRRSSARPRRSREGDAHPRAAARRLEGLDRAAVRLDQPLRDRQPEARATGVGRADEPVEHRGELVGGDARPGVVDLEERPAAAGRGRGRVTRAAAGRVPDRVRQQVASTSATRTGSASIARHVVPTSSVSVTPASCGRRPRTDARRPRRSRATSTGSRCSDEHALLGHRQRPQVLEQPRHHLGLVDQRPQALGSAG